jgi:hypothetical protein
LIWESTNALLLIPRRDRPGDAGAVDTKAASFYRA